MRSCLPFLPAACVALASSGTAAAQPEADALEDDLAPPVFTARLYGYVDSRVEKSTAQPAYVGAVATEASQPVDFDVPNFHVMVQGHVHGKYRFFINLASPGSGSPTDDASVDLRNAWVELPVYRDYLNVRAGKTYRRFGLYNEILDAVPTFIGIEPPEMFDSDHLMLTRTTNLMVHGRVTSGDVTTSYAAFTGNDERAGKQLPFGADVRFDLGDHLLAGASLYTSNGDAVPTTSLEAPAPPQGGVAHWMERDRFQVYSIFAQLKRGPLTAQAEYTAGVHDARRDPERVRTLEQSSLSQRQRDRFGVDGDPDTQMDAINTIARYTVHAAYLRVGRELETAGWSLIPYGQFDYYVNPEMIADEAFGGDNEAGLADGGKKYKTTGGLVARPAEFVALKLDMSVHTQPVDGRMFSYLEGRLSLSLYWELAGD